MTDLTKEDIIAKNKITKNNILKKTFSIPTEKTKRIETKDFIIFVSEVIVVSNQEAQDMILNNEVTVNGNIINDIKYLLKSGDIIRVENGHFLNNSGYMAVVI